MWCTPEDVRKELGLLSEDVDDVTLLHYIEKAQDSLRDQISIYVFDEELAGDIDGVNTTFRTAHYPIADCDYDLAVGTSDVVLYKWGEYGSIDTRSTIAASTIYPDYGIIVLSDPPEGTIKAVTCTYYYYPTRIDMGRLPKVCALLAAYYYVRAEMLLIPEKWAHGAYRFERGTPAEMLYSEYERELGLLIRRDLYKASLGSLDLLRG